MLLDKALQYAQDVIKGEEITTTEVKTQCQIFLDDYFSNQYQEDFLFYFDSSEIEKIEKILNLLNYATGIDVVGQPVLNHLFNFQAFFFTNIFGWRFKNDVKKYRYRDVTLFIPRKNAKTWMAGVILIILLLTEDDYSELYSICLDRDLAAEVKKAMTQIINASPAIRKHFKVSTTLIGKIICKLTHSFYQARTAEANKNNSIRPSAYIADEIGAFKDYKNINAMKSGQLSVKNPLRFKLTTAYAESQSIMIEELEYIRKVFNGVVVDDRMFALLYYAEDEHKWDDIGLKQANPLRVEENYQEIKDNRKSALEKPSEQTEFLTKHLNIFVHNDSEEKYLEYDLWKKCQTDKIDLQGKEVVVGVDLALTTDLTAVSIMYLEDGKFYLKSKGFLPEESLKKRREKLDYRAFERQGHCKITKGHIVSYNAVEDYIRSIEEVYNCKIKCIVSDPFNALQMMENLGEDYDVILIKQTYTSLSPSIKSFRDEVYLNNVFYEKNPLLDWCVANAVTVKGKVTEDILLAKENKNKQRIDLLVASIFAYSQLYLDKSEIKIEITEEYLKSLGWS
ncbi:terminase large subunit [Desulfitobacterium sp. PCE1]|uniref:terminase large subunit n=1 Tax=Desulfitobacterium sp. PCE1 TaxID=146907 RepID=UPI0003804BFC|nr:terminase TerL endonuclease subunit [Desulfitobacterium sp. PCE1]